MQSAKEASIASKEICCQDYYMSVGGKSSGKRICMRAGTIPNAQIYVQALSNYMYNGPYGCAVPMKYAAGASQLYVTTAVAATAMYMM